MSTSYTLKFYKGRKLIGEQAFNGADYEDGDGEMTPTRAQQIANDCASIIEEAISCNPLEGEKP